VTKHFDFGKNWVSYAKKGLTPDRFAAAQNEMKLLMADIPLAGKSFLDIGFGQGLSLFAAQEAGAQVCGCDSNPLCGDALRVTASKIGATPDFPVVIGSILSEQTCDSLRALSPAADRLFDIVLAWGVLHHTGNLAKAFAHAVSLTRKNGYLIVALYNRHWSSPAWNIVKHCYCASPSIIQRLMVGIGAIIIAAAKLLVTRQNPFKQQRGMSFSHNVVDWIGGYPYEYASIDEVIAMGARQGCTCSKVVKAQVPTGCNEFIFIRTE
jgi:2-polyprenyl-3-methyl-5-hydroxy-6-metoxy-1,4-benzoquinol methylase